MEHTPIQHALDMQSKFKFYLLSLTFTLLAASVQTAALGTSLLSDVPELLAWISLLISGLTGLKQLEIAPQIYSHQQDNYEGNSAAGDEADKVAARVYRWYKWHRATFVSGLILLVIARAIAGLVDCTSSAP